MKDRNNAKLKFQEETKLGNYSILHRIQLFDIEEISERSEDTSKSLNVRSKLKYVLEYRTIRFNS